MITTAITLSLLSCGGSRGGPVPGGTDPLPQLYTVTVTVTGLSGTAVLRNNGGDDLTVTSDGDYPFATGLVAGDSYAVTVASHPPLQSCTVTNGTGSVVATNVTGISVTCAPYNVVFVTSATCSGNLGGLSGADAKCATAATAAGLPANTYRAWLATSTVSAGSRLGTARGWVRLDGMPVADRVSDLTTGKILHPIQINELGAAVGQESVFTGAQPSGATSAYTCLGWTSAQGTATGTIGRTDATTTWFTNEMQATCDSPLRIYCFGVDHATPLVVEPASGRIAFITSSPMASGAFGLAQADAACQAQATAAGFGGTFKALLAANGASAASRFSTSGATWVRPDGVPVMTQASDLASGSLLTPINVTAAGAYIGRDSVWLGGGSSTCNDWTSTGDLATYSDASCAQLGHSTYRTIMCNTSTAYVHCLQE